MMATHRRSPTPRHFLALSDWSAAELTTLLDMAERLKRTPVPKQPPLRGRVLGLLFQKPSIRTRVSFEVGMAHLGGTALYMHPDDIQLGVREPIKDVARVLSRYLDGMVVRTYAHANVVALAEHATVPVINGLSDLTHPCQALADLLTIRERYGKLRGLSLAYVGDGNNVLHALLEAGALMGMHVTYATPKRFAPRPAVVRAVRQLAQRTHARIHGTTDPRTAVQGADVVYTDVWTSMGQERERAARRRAFRGFNVSESLLGHAKSRCIVMHCLPAHRGEEITEGVIESRQSVIFEQAANRLHVQKALLAQLLKE
jgi:ornithine carbamoyltransferase